MEYMQEHGKVDGVNVMKVCNKAAQDFMSLEETQSF